VAKAIDSKVAAEIEVFGKKAIMEGAQITINYALPSIAISWLTKDGVAEVFMQGEDAISIIDEIPVNVNDKHYILWYIEGARL